MKNKYLIFLLLLMWGLSQLVTAQPVTHAPASIKSLESSFDWALRTADQTAAKKGFYVGYLIEREKSKDGRICMGKHEGKKETRTLYDILYDRKAGEKQPEILSRQFAILFRFDFRPEDRFDFQKIKLSNLDTPVDLDDVPLFWLGKMKTEESIGFLETCFKRIDSTKNREKIVTAVGIHGRSPGIFGFLKKVLAGDFADKIRESAAFWIGQQQTPEAANVLLHTVTNDKSSKVRENAVFGLYLVNCQEADDALVRIATKGKEKRTRKKAIFWLGQKAVKRTAELLGGIIDDDPDSDIQKAAVFALSQHPEGLDRLIKIATTHRSLKVRKQAIFWLGQSDDPRALETILGILKK